LLDFGIAKLLDPTQLDSSGKSVANPTIANAMTPAYASPEQVKGEAITTASDVYALGVLLYRLLTGKSPYKNDTTKPLELAKEIVDTEPERPSTIVTRSDSPRPTERSLDDKKIVRTLDTKRLQRELRGDLDNIILMALRKDPARVMHRRNNWRTTCCALKTICPFARAPTHGLIERKNLSCAIGGQRVLRR
jgi:eukaryotic-like serine/threonine-protein kinase